MRSPTQKTTTKDTGLQFGITMLSTLFHPRLGSRRRSPLQSRSKQRSGLQTKEVSCVHQAPWFLLNCPCTCSLGCLAECICSARNTVACSLQRFQRSDRHKFRIRLRAHQHRCPGMCVCSYVLLFLCLFFISGICFPSVPAPYHNDSSSRPRSFRYMSLPSHTQFCCAHCPADAIWGPVILAVILFTAVLLNFIVRGNYIPHTNNFYAL